MPIAAAIAGGGRRPPCPRAPPRAAARFSCRCASRPGLCRQHARLFTDRIDENRFHWLAILAVPRRNVLSTSAVFLFGSKQIALAETTGGTFREYIDTFDGYTFLYPRSWIQVRGAGADIFFRDPFVLDENMSVEISSPSSSKYMTVEDLGPPEKAAERVLQQYLTEFMSTRLGVRRTSDILSASSKVADDGKLYYEVEKIFSPYESFGHTINIGVAKRLATPLSVVNIKSYASNNELAVMPQDRVQRLEWDRRYLSVLGVENKRLYELRLQSPEQVFKEEEGDLRRVMDSFRVIKTA
uniref:PsbP C-terminal domain-containing protein n=1 Tax=Oryza brachyantha TaxID=4533 RepID=J3NE81_ORYBR